MATLTVRIRPETHRKLQKLAQSSGKSLPEVLERAIGEYERQQFLVGCNTAFERLRQSPEEWAQEMEERAAWDATLSDDLDQTERSW